MEGVVLVNTHNYHLSLIVGILFDKMQRHLLSTFIYIKGPLKYKKYSKCKAGMFGVFALDLKAIYFIVLEDLISLYKLVII